MDKKFVVEPTDEEMKRALQADATSMHACRGCGMIHIYFYDENNKIIAISTMDPVDFGRSVHDVQAQMRHDLEEAGVYKKRVH